MKITIRARVLDRPSPPPDPTAERPKTFRPTATLVVVVVHASPRAAEARIEFGVPVSDGRGGKFSSVQSLEKPQNAKILAPSSAVALTLPLAPEPPRRGRGCSPRSIGPRCR